MATLQLILRKEKRPGIFMTASDIFIEFTAHLKTLFHPTDSYPQSTHRFTTQELLLQISQHYGVSFNAEEKTSLDSTAFVDQMKAVGFTSVMLPGSASLMWLMVEKK